MTAQAIITVNEAEAIQRAEKTFADFVDEWLKDLASDGEDGKRGKKERTLSTYRDALTVFQRWLENSGITSPTRQDVINWRTALTKTRTQRNPEKTLSLTTQNLYLSSVRVFFKWLADKYGVVNLAAGIEGQRVSREHKRGFLSCAEMKKLLAVVDTSTLQGKRDKAILATLIAGGLRTVEVSRLRICDFYPESGVYKLNVLGKGRDDREDVKISRQAAQLIRDWLAAREAADVVSDDSPLFCSLSNSCFGEPITSASVSRVAKNYLRAAGLKDKEYKTTDGKRKPKIEVKPIVAHSLRASLATESHLRGASLEQVQQQLRHARIQTTMIYIAEAEKTKNPCSDLVSNEIF